MLRGPETGTAFNRCSPKYSMLAFAGAGPLEFRAATLPLFFMQTSAKTSPPGPHVSGRTTVMTNAAASAASTALPPSCKTFTPRSEEHTSELQSHVNLVCRLLLEKKKKKNKINLTEKIKTRTSY